MTRIEITTDYIKTSVDDIKYTLRDHIEVTKAEMKQFRNECDDKYAGKLTEKIVYALVGAICLAVLGGGLMLVIR